MDNSLGGFSQPRIFWNSRKRSANGQNLPKAPEDNLNAESGNQEQLPVNENDEEPSSPIALSERRKALFEPLEPTNARRLLSDEIPPPDFDTACYPKGWLVGKKRRLVNVDVVESMRRIAVQEMNRKVSLPTYKAIKSVQIIYDMYTLCCLQDLEINGLNEQLEEDAKILQHLQLQLLQERSKRADVERDNSVLQNQVSMLMNMLQDAEEVNEDATNDS